MSDKICPNCKSKINESSKFCPECGCSLENQNENTGQETKQDFFSFTEDIASKIQNRLDNDNIFNTNEIKEMIRNLDEESINKLLDKYGISPSRIKFLTLNKLFDKVNISKLKEDLIEFGIISPDSDIETVKAEANVEDEDEETTTPEEENDTTEEKPSDNSSICSECGFENRPNVKFCTKCGNKLI